MEEFEPYIIKLEKNNVIKPKNYLTNYTIGENN